MDDVANPLYRYFGARFEFENSERLLRPVVIVADQVGDETARVTESLGIGETVVRASQLDFGPLSVFDIDHYSVPMRDAPFRVAKRLANGLNPPILTVRAPELVDILVGRSRGDCVQP